MAREEEEGGSLDMLLDTLCNTFGGIILIAILLAVSVNEKRKEVYNEVVRTNEDVSDLLRERERVRNSLLDLQDEHEEEIIEIEDELEEKRVEVVELEDDVRAAQTEGADKEALAKKMQEDLDENQIKLDELERDRSTNFEKVSRLESIVKHRELIQAIKKKPFQKVGLPVEKATEKTQYPILVAHGRAYPMMRVAGRRIVKNDAGLTWKDLGDGILELSADPAQGYNANREDELEAFLATIDMVGRAANKEVYVNLFVQPESNNFTLFNKIRDEVVLRKFSYNFNPISSVPVKLDSKGFVARTLN